MANLGLFSKLGLNVLGVSDPVLYKRKQRSNFNSCVTYTTIGVIASRGINSTMIQPSIFTFQPDELAWRTSPCRPRG